MRVPIFAVGEFEARIRIFGLGAVMMFAGSVLYSQQTGTSLIEAAQSGRVAEVRRALSQGADVDTRDDNGVTALAHAVYRGQLEAAGVLLQAGARSDLPDRRGRTAWSWAAYRGDEAMIALFLEAGIDPDRTITGGVTALMLAALQGHGGVVRQLLEAGTNPGAADDEGSTAADWAADRGHAEIARLIAEWTSRPTPRPEDPVAVQETATTELHVASGPLDGWPAAVVDTAANIEYLSPVERAIVLELNKVRTDPARYARLYIGPMRERFDGTVLRYPGAIPIRTEEGVAAVEECYRELLRATPVGPLQPREGLSRAAEDHARDQGPRGALGHTGSDGSSPGDRVRRYETDLSTWGENVAYGWDRAARIVYALLVDDGVRDRGHRENIMNPRYTSIGVAVGPHRRYEHVMVMEFAAFR
jgi:hypothetical protein